MSRITPRDTRTSPRATDWRDQAACRGTGDLMFPHDNNARATAAAKRICAPCPVWQACLDHALATGDNRWGIRGGMDPDERRALLKNRANGSTPARPKRRAPRTLAEAFQRRATRTTDGHVTWTGGGHLTFQSVEYTTLQAAFIVGHGRQPVGLVRRTCGRDCYRGDHLTDQTIREAAAVCGTTQGYWLHRKRRETACEACRRAHTEAGAERRAAAKAAV